MKIYPPEEYVQEDLHGAEGVSISNLHGVAWWEAPVPRWWHRCWVQSKGRIGWSRTERCACGAIRMPEFGTGWSERNTRG